MAVLDPAPMAVQGNSPHRTDTLCSQVSALRLARSHKGTDHSVRRTPMPPTLQELKRQIKETWPEAKNLADAKREN